MLWLGWADCQGSPPAAAVARNDGPCAWGQLATVIAQLRGLPMECSLGASHAGKHSPSAGLGRVWAGLTIEALALPQHVCNVARHDGVHLADVLA